MDGINGNFFAGGNNSPTRLANIRITQSVQGNPTPVVMGCQRVQQALLWLDGFTAKQESGGGKGGGKGGNVLPRHSADVLAALVCWPVSGVGNVWSGQQPADATEPTSPLPSRLSMLRRTLHCCLRTMTLAFQHELAELH